MLDVKSNFFSTAKPAPVSMPLIQWMNDPGYRRDYGQWVYDNFDSLVKEFKKYGRFLTVKELEDSIL